VGYGTHAARPAGAAVLADHPRGAAGPWQVRGRLRADPQPLDGTWQVDLGVEAILVDGIWLDEPLRVRTTVYDAGHPGRWTAGRRFEAFLALRLPRGVRNPLVPPRAPPRASGIDVRASIKSFRQLRDRGPAPAARRALSATRSAVRKAALRRFGPDAALVNALLLGERGGVTTVFTNALARTGLIHLFAISGLHVGIVVAALFALLRILGAARPHAALALACLLPVLYVMVVPRPPIARASLMAACVLLALAAGRRTSAVNGLAAATLALTCIDPWITRNFGFQLSSAATAGILALGSTKAPGRLPVAAFSVSCAAQLAVAPWLVANTFRLPLLAVPLNLVAVPVMATAIVAAMAALAIDGLGLDTLSSLTASACRVLLDGLRRLVLAADLRVAPFTVPASATLWAILASLVGHLVLIDLVRRRTAPLDAAARPHWRVLAAAALGGCALAYSITRLPRTPSTPSAPVFRVVALDVGQGDALLVETHEDTVMVDTGGSPLGDYDTGAAILAPALRARGIRALDAVVITHLHADHAGGLGGLLREIPTTEVWAPGFDRGSLAAQQLLAAAAQVPLHTLARGDLRGDSVCTWSALHPAPEGSPSPAAGLSNDSSLVLLLRCGARSILLTGDGEAAAEAAYSPLLPPARGGVLKSPHHGSRTSSTVALLDRVAARHVVISVGWRNRFGLPDATVLARYRDRGMAVYRTDRDGAVTTSIGARIRVTGERWTAGRGRHVVGGWLY